MASKLEEAMNKPKGWMSQEHREKAESNAVYLGIMEPWDNSTPIGEDEVEVPFYKEICLSAGNGFADDIEDYNGYRLRFARSTLKNTASIQNASCALPRMAAAWSLLFLMAQLLELTKEINP